MPAIAGIGHVFHCGEYWMLLYDGCRHEQWFARTADRLYDLAEVERVVRAHYPTCGSCDWAVRVARFEAIDAA